MKTFYRYIILTFFLYPSITLLYSQNEIKLVYKDWSPIDTLYSIHDDNFKRIPGFYYPAMYKFDSILYKGINPVKKLKRNKLLGDEKKIQGWCKIFSVPIQIDTSTLFYLRLYLENIKEYVLFLNSGNDSCWYKKIQEVDYARYQEPLFLNLNQWENIRTGEKLISDKRKTNTIHQLILQVKPYSKKFNFFIGDFMIYKRKEFEHPYYDPLFESLNNINSLEHCKYNSLSKLPNSPLLLSSYNMYNPGGNEYFVVSEDTTKSKMKEIETKIVSSILHYYPFYNERKIDKEHVLAKFLKITKYGPDQFWDSLRVLVKQFHDPHFFIEKKNEQRGTETHIATLEKLIDPVRAYQINGEFYIAAIFDTTLLDKVFIGDKIIAIKGNNIGKALNQLEDSFSGTRNARKQKSISQLLKGYQGDTTSIILVRELKDTFEYKIIYDALSIKINSNFKPKHCDFKFYNDIAYFRANLFMKDTWLRFLNYADELKKSKGLIFDIRNNGGGDLQTVLDIFSMFIKEPCIVLNYESPVLDNFRETCVVKPNNIFHFDIPVVILINKGTACGSELFAYLMKKV